MAASYAASSSPQAMHNASWLLIAFILLQLLFERRASAQHFRGERQLTSTNTYNDDEFNVVVPPPPTEGSSALLGSSLTNRGADDDNDEAERANQAEQILHHNGQGDGPDIISSLYLEGDTRKCNKDPPYLYVTLHDFPNLLKYTIDGCLLDHKVLQDMPIQSKVELRGMVMDGGHLYVANAAYDEPQVMLFGECDKDGRRLFKSTVVSKDANRGADHAYGLTLDSERNIYASFQHTDVVLRFDGHSFNPLPLPPVLQAQLDYSSFYKGTFHQFGRTGEHSTSEQGIRGILMVGHKLWAANENVGGVEVIDESTGVVTDVIMIESPIGLAYSPKHDLVFISSKVKHREGCVTAYNRHTLQPTLITYRTDKMTHPTGVAVHDSVLYVAEQFLNRLFAFEVETGRHLGKVIEKLPGEIEQIALSDC